MQDLSSLTRDQTRARCSGSTESQPLDLQGSPGPITNQELESANHTTPRVVYESVVGEQKLVGKICWGLKWLKLLDLHLKGTELGAEGLGMPAASRQTMENWGRSKGQQRSQKDTLWGEALRQPNYRLSLGLCNVVLGQLPPSLPRWRNMKRHYFRYQLATQVGSLVDGLMQTSITETGKLRHWEVSSSQPRNRHRVGSCIPCLYTVCCLVWSLPKLPPLLSILNSWWTTGQIVPLAILVFSNPLHFSFSFPCPFPGTPDSPYT